ncbi:radical SAM protein [Streptomyces sp. SAS_267]
MQRSPPRCGSCRWRSPPRCQLTCPSHCYAQAGPARGHGRRTARDWRRIIDEAAVLGTTAVQFIGGEPTLHSDFAELGARRSQRLVLEADPGLLRRDAHTCGQVF